jgi:cold shock CspA family protein
MLGGFVRRERLQSRCGPGGRAAGAFARFFCATVKSYCEDFGFLTAAGRPDIFVHASVLKRAGMPRLEQHEQVLVRVMSDEKGKLRAIAIRPFPRTSTR